MLYGTERTTFGMGNGSTMTSVKKYRNGEPEKVLRHYRIRVKVGSVQDEMSEFIRFTDELNRCRANRTLTYDKEDASTRPAFIIDYPKENIDNSWFIVKNYCIIDSR